MARPRPFDYRGWGAGFQTLEPAAGERSERFSGWSIRGRRECAAFMQIETVEYLFLLFEARASDARFAFAKISQARRPLLMVDDEWTALPSDGATEALPCDMSQPQPGAARLARGWNRALLFTLRPLVAP